jgi:colanic acid/amylovoran biosynthesis glycosyltransferase
MKIAIIVQEFPCLSETFILSHIVGMLDRGHHVHVYANYGVDSPENNEVIEKNNLNGKVFYFTHGKRKIPNNKLLRVLTTPSVFCEFALRDGWTLLRTLNVIKYGEAAASLSLFYQAAIFMKNGPYDIVHCHFGQNGQIAAALKDVGVIKGKVITAFHGYDLSTYIQASGRDVYHSLFTHGDLCLPISEKWKNELIELGCPPEKILIQRMGVDLARFTFQARRAMDGEQLRVLSIARFVEKKGLEYGIDAMATVVQQHPKLLYQIVGDGILKEKLQQQIVDLHIEENVQLLGWKDHQEVARLLGNAHIFLAPSVTAENGDQEGIPVSIMESMALGLPIISTKHGGIPELVEDGISGFLVKERDVDSLATRLLYLIDNPDICSEMGRAGHASIEKKYDVNMLNDQLVTLYKGLLQEKSPCQSVP